MSSNVPISSLPNKASLSYSDGVPKLTEGNPQGLDQGDTDLNVLQTSKDLKTAQLQGKSVSIGEVQLIKAIEKANTALQGVMTSLEFSIHEKTHEIMVKVVDKSTGETIREIPSEKVLDMVAHMWEISGMVVDKKV